MKKNARTFYLLFSAVTILLISGCKKDLTNDQNDPLHTTANRNSALTPLGATPDVYVAGSDNGHAVYWKNGVEVSLPGGAMANGIVAIGTNVYVCGYGNDPTTGAQLVQYWLNGVLTNLTGASFFSFATGIAVSGADVYICGYDLFTDQAYYWKNGTIHNLPSGEPTAIAISGSGDIYMSNALEASTGTSYYKNGALVTLTGGDASTNTMGVAVNGTHFYLVGVKETSMDVAKRWDDGVSAFMSSGLDHNTPMAVAVDPVTGGVYASGTMGDDPNNLQIGWWNNLGDQATLGTGSGKFVSTATGIAVDGSSRIYVCGTLSNNSGPSTAYYWDFTVSGSPNQTQLSNGTTNATAHAITIGQ
jgi:hypothetical protein